MNDKKENKKKFLGLTRFWTKIYNLETAKEAIDSTNIVIGILVFIPALSLNQHIYGNSKDYFSIIFNIFLIIFFAFMWFLICKKKKYHLIPIIFSLAIVQTITGILLSDEDVRVYIIFLVLILYSIYMFRGWLGLRK